MAIGRHAATYQRVPTEGFSETLNVLHSLSEPLLGYLFKCHRRVMQSTMGVFLPIY